MYIIRFREIAVWRDPAYKVAEDVTEKGKQYSMSNIRLILRSCFESAKRRPHEIRFVSHESIVNHDDDDDVTSNAPVSLSVSPQLKW